MANCRLSLQNNSVQAKFLIPSIKETGSVSNPFESELFKFESTKADTATFDIKILSSFGSFELYFDVFRQTETGFAQVGTATITEFNTSLNFNLLEDFYYFCVHGNTAISFEITLLITNYVPIAVMKPDFFSGEKTETEIYFDLIPCNEAIFYEILEGKLPPDLKMNGTGRIDGIIDKMDPNLDNSIDPSFTWWKYDVNEEKIVREGGDVYTHWWEKEIKQTEIVTVSTSYDWPILVRAAFISDPTIYTDRWFKICVRNNWSFDRDNFLKLLDCLELFIYDECPELAETPFSPETEPLCPPCPEPESNYQPLTKETLQDLCESCEIKPEYQELIDLEELKRQANLIPVETIDEKIDAELKNLTVQKKLLCDLNCETETFVELQEIPKELCPPCNEPIKEIKELEKQPCLTIEYQLIKLLYQMEESKRPRDGFVCFPHGNRYSESLRQRNKINKLKSLCKEC